MTLTKLLEGIEYAAHAEDCEITSITCDSRLVGAGCLFVALKGVRFDGHDHAADALVKGAAAVLTERALGLPHEVVVNDTREAYGILSGNWFGNPAKELKLLGVTGTNGKTTITYIVKQIMESAGKKTGLIGTIQSEIGDMTLPAKHTTPDPYQLHALLRRMADAGMEYVVMEVSSHALDQQRVAGLHFMSAAFTNLTQDHLDYHGDMEGYYGAKKRLFDMCDRAVINLDDKYGKRLYDEAGCPVKLSFSCESDEADYTARNIKFSADGSHFAMLSEGVISRVSIPMPGRFSVSNALAAAVLCLSAGISRDEVVRGLSESRGVPGRLEILDTGTPYTVIRDYAHSPDGLEKVLSTVREFAPARVVALFGCAGNRDRTKRPLMGEIVSRLADSCILTSDNPRDEDPMRIIEDCLPGVRKHRTPCKVIVDRYDAIQWALDNAKDDDILVLCGKGHEDYQVLDFGTIFFDEKVIVRELLAKKDGSK
jgi:UDP-N-acetylmuramoyl-L-alanyl-D-glutamate--2,6-diaminopimelate ligase